MWPLIHKDNGGLIFMKHLGGCNLHHVSTEQVGEQDRLSPPHSVLLDPARDNSECNILG